MQDLIHIFVLAGGKSTRMGTNKAFVPLHGRALLERALDVARGLSPEVRIVGAMETFGKFAPVVEDIFPHCGPLGGIHAALRSSPSDLNLMLAVDLPFVTVDLLRYLVARAEDSAAMITVPRCGKLQPLCAVYRREFAGPAEKALRSGRYKIDALFEPERTLIIAEEELKVAGFTAAMFRNLNTPEDMAEVLDPGVGERS